MRLGGDVIFFGLEGSVPHRLTLRQELRVQMFEDVWRGGAALTTAAEAQQNGSLRGPTRIFPPEVLAACQKPSSTQAWLETSAHVPPSGRVDPRKRPAPRRRYTRVLASWHRPAPVGQATSLPT
jgi:hypothetical protein